MGILVDDVRFLLAARSWGVRFDRALTIGRQNLYVDSMDLAEIVAEAGDPSAGPLADAVRQDEFVDSLLRLIGARNVDSLDASDFEGATIVHDLNRPVPDRLKESYDVVLEAGSIEHVFDIRRALANLMEMVREGGHLVIISPANNWCGHGFYQFSPELYFRVLSQDNGYKIVRLIIREDFAGSTWYDVADPATVRSRVQLLSCLPVSLAIVAQRVKAGPVLEIVPQQSDYASLWVTGPRGAGVSRPPAAGLRDRLTARLRQLATRVAPGLTLALRRQAYTRRLLSAPTTSTRNRRLYTPVSR